MLIAEATTNQELKFICRSQCPSGTITLTDEQKNETTTLSGVTFAKDRHYLVATVDLSTYSNERNYLMVVSGVLIREIYRGKLFLTSQDPDSYSINNGLYSEPTSTNEYLVAE